MGRPTAIWMAEHPMFRTRVPAKMLVRVESAMRKRGIDRAGLIIYATETILAERLPESQDGLQRVEIGREDAQAAADALIAKAEEKRRSADVVYGRTKDLGQRTELRREADQLDGLAAWFLEIVDGSDFRVHVIETGMKLPRIRRIQSRDAQA